MGSKAQGKGGRRPSGEPVRKTSAETGEEAHLRWSRRNYAILGAGGVAIVAGFVLLALGDKTFAPILLVGGYLGLIPWGLLAGGRRDATDRRPKTPGE